MAYWGLKYACIELCFLTRQLTQILSLLFEVFLNPTRCLPTKNYDAEKVNPASLRKLKTSLFLNMTGFTLAVANVHLLNKTFKNTSKV